MRSCRHSSRPSTHPATRSCRSTLALPRAPGPISCGKQSASSHHQHSASAMPTFMRVCIESMVEGTSKSLRGENWVAQAEDWQSCAEVLREQKMPSPGCLPWKGTPSCPSLRLPQEADSYTSRTKEIKRKRKSGSIVGEEKK